MTQTPVRSGDLPPLVIVGGFYPLLTPMPLGRAARFFRRSGGGRSVVIVPHGLLSMRDIERRSELAAQTIRRAQADANGPIDILAYSMGGPSSLLALQRCAGLAAGVRRFVSYGSPYRGTTASLAILMMGYFNLMAEQLSPGSAILEEIAASGLPPGPRYVSVAGEKDWLCPAPSAVLPGAEHVLCPYDHLDFLVSVRLYAFLDRYLGY